MRTHFEQKNGGKRLPSPLQAAHHWWLQSVLLCFYTLANKLCFCSSFFIWLFNGEPNQTKRIPPIWQKKKCL